jgi:hypothetical protein
MGERQDSFGINRILRRILNDFGRISRAINTIAGYTPGCRTDLVQIRLCNFHNRSIARVLRHGN